MTVNSLIAINAVHIIFLILPSQIERDDIHYSLHIVNHIILFTEREIDLDI